MHVSKVTGAEGVDSVSVFPEIAALVFSNIYAVFTHMCTGPLRGLHIGGNRITLATTSTERGAYLVKAVVLSQPLTSG